MQTIDLHCDTIMKFFQGRHLRDMADSHINLAKMREGGCMAQCFAIYIPTHGDEEKQGLHLSPQEYFDEACRLYRAELAENADVIAPAYTAQDVLRNRDAGKMSAILTVEDGVAVDGRMEELERYAQRGVRMLSLTWNFENCFGYPNSADPQLHARGLKPFGLEAIGRMNELGIAIDVSHLSEGGFWDVARNTKKPFVASHSCARAVCDHPRNLTDGQLRALAERGGVCGVNFFSRFLHGEAQGDRSSLDDVMRHLLHMKRVAGVDVLALGSDYDGIGSELEWGDCAGTQKLVGAMERCFTDDEIEKICWKNALRAMRDIVGR